MHSFSCFLAQSRSAQFARIGWHFVQARRRWATLSQSNLTVYQAARMRHIMAYTRKHSPFYREHWGDHNPAQWQTLPTVDKRLMMESFTTFNTCGIERERAMQVALEAERQRNFRPVLEGLTVGLSSGTSGHRGLFLVSPAEQMAWAGVILSRTLHHLRWRPYKVAFFLRSNSNLYEQVDGRLVRFRYFDLMLPLDQAVNALNHFQPDILVGPPSLLELLTAELGGRLHITPERLISVAEVLEPQDEERLRQAFGVPVHQIYQCTEGFIAASCAHGSLHVQEDIVVVQGEALPDDATRITPIVTDLWRTTQPIIRYRLNDILTLSNVACSCGSDFRVIARIEGRCDDIFDFPTNASPTRPVFPDLIRKMILLGSADIEDYQAVQDYCGHIHIYLAVRSDAIWADVAQAVRQSVHNTLAAYNCTAREVTITPGLISLANGAKRRRVWRRSNQSQ